MIELGRIAEVVDGVVLGDSKHRVDSVKSLEKATDRSITFFSNPKLKRHLSVCTAGAVLISPQHADLFSGNRVVVTDPYLAYARISRLFKPVRSRNMQKVDPSTWVADTAFIDNSVVIGKCSTIDDQVKLAKGVVIGNCVNIGAGVVIGQESVIEDQVVIQAGCRVGKRCHISSGAVIGASGFGYAPSADRWEKIEQLGAVRIGDDVDVGANTTIDRGTLEYTIIENGVKLDNQIQIAHNASVGENTIMAGCSAVAGSTRIGRRCKIGGRVSILGHLEIADDVTIMANSMVAKSICEAGEYASMITVQPVKQWRKNLAIIRQLDKLMRKRNRLEKPDHEQ